MASKSSASSSSSPVIISPPSYASSSQADSSSSIVLAPPSSILPALRVTEKNLDPDGGFERTRSQLGTRLLARFPALGLGALAVDPVTGAIFVADNTASGTQPFIRVFHADRTFAGIIPTEALDRGTVRASQVPRGCLRLFRVSNLVVDHRTLYVSTWLQEAPPARADYYRQGAQLCHDSLLRLPLDDPSQGGILVTSYDDNLGVTQFRAVGVHAASQDVFVSLAYAVRVYGGDCVEAHVASGAGPPSSSSSAPQPLAVVERWTRKELARAANGLPGLFDGCPWPDHDCGTYAGGLVSTAHNLVFSLIVRGPSSVAVVARPVRASTAGSFEGPVGVGPSTLWAMWEDGVVAESATLALLPLRLGPEYGGESLEEEEARLQQRMGVGVGAAVGGGGGPHHIPPIPCVILRRLAFTAIPDEATGGMRYETFGDKELAHDVYGLVPPMLLPGGAGGGGGGGRRGAEASAPPSLNPLPRLAVIPDALIYPINNLSRLVVNPVTGDAYYADSLPPPTQGADKGVLRYAVGTRPADELFPPGVLVNGGRAWRGGPAAGLAGQGGRR
jgi:hypothetical protein